MNRNPFDGVIGHSAAWHGLTAAFKTGRLGPAYLFVGPEGVGKRLVALRFARMLICPKGGGDDCTDCRRVDGRTHPSLSLLERQEDKKEIPVQEIRELLQSLALIPSTPQRRVVLIDGAEVLSEESMNTLLKTLEEPPRSTHFLLVTATPTGLLGTIRSRCQIVRFTSIAAEQIEEHLKERGFPAPDASIAAGAACGSIGRALTLVGSTAALRTRLDETLPHILRHDFSAVIEPLLKIRDPQQARRDAIELIDLLLRVLREGLRSIHLGTGTLPGWIPASARPLLDQGRESLLRWTEVLMEHRTALNRNSNVALTMEDALVRR